MRKDFLFIAAILIAGFIFASCGSKGKTEENSIVGKWEFIGVDPDIKTSDPDATAKIIAFITKDNKENNGLIAEYTEDGRMLDNNGELQTYSISKDEITTNFEGMSAKNKFQIKNDTLSIFEDITSIFKNEGPRSMMGIADSVRVEKAVFAINFVRKK